MFSFKGGVFLDEKKELLKDRPIRSSNTKELLVFPLSQHIGKPAKAIVKVGDEVKQGQIIAEADGLISANVLSSVSGKVKALENRLCSNGKIVESIIIENDFKYQTINGFGKERDYKSLSREEIIDIVRDAGIVGLGGACFPTHVKLNPKDKDAIDYVLVNASECEPYLNSDNRLLLEEADMLILGLEIILKLFPHAKGIICIEDNKREAYKEIQKRLENNMSISCVLTKTKYPQGGERQLIYAVTKRKLNSKLLPADVGVIVQNVATTIAIAYAVSKSEPLTSKVMTLAGDGLKDNINVKVRLGISYKDLADEVGGLKDNVKKMINGGPMMGISLYDLDVPVAKNSSSLLCFREDPIKELHQTNCINCGRCSSVCPENLIPTMMYKVSKNNKVEEFLKLYGVECIECGSCSYVCPAKLPLVQYFKMMKPKAQALEKELAEKKKLEQEQIKKEKENKTKEEEKNGKQ